jgi:hypothetical protein
MPTSLDCRDRQFAGTALFDAGPDTHQRPCSGTYFGLVRVAGNERTFTGPAPRAR